jgi:hypothetical protein
MDIVADAELGWVGSEAVAWNDELDVVRRALLSGSKWQFLCFVWCDSYWFFLFCRNNLASFVGSIRMVIVNREPQRTTKTLTTINQ